MSGIFGVYSPKSRIPTDIHLQRMQSAIAHRGPDGDGTWIAEDIGIGHLRFVTTPEAEWERSPFIDVKGYVITADVRLDNRDQLIAQLELTEQAEQKLTDPELLLKAYQHWGNQCPQHLLGAFAFVIWDPKEQKFFGARDHMGVKPFYYSQQSDFFGFASEIKALLRSPQVSAEIDLIRLADLLTAHLHDPVHTIYRDIVRLPAAHWFERALTGRFECDRYWQLDPTHEIHLESDEAYVQAFQEIFAQAVSCRLRSKGKLGTHLSGGMDSSSITAMAHQLLPKHGPPLETLSATFQQVPHCDESEYIHATLQQGKYNPHFVPADHSGPLTHWQKIFTTLDEPALGNGYLSWTINNAAQKAGIKILLNGYDGDTTIGHGTLYPQELARSGQWRQALQESKLLTQRFARPGITPLQVMRKDAIAVLLELRQSQQWSKILWGIWQIYRPLKLNLFDLLFKFYLRPLYRHLKPQRKRNTPPSHQPQAKTPSNTQHFKGSEILNSETFQPWVAEIQKHQQQSKPTADKPLSVRQEQWQTLSSGIITFPMELLDHVSTPFQIEPRYPLMDKRLVEFCLALPAHQKLRQGWSRFILRQSMTGLLPPEVQWRETKTDLSDSFDFGLKQYDLDILTNALFNNSEKLKHFVNLEMVQKHYSETGNQSERVIELWPVITLSLWLKAQKIHH